MDVKDIAIEELNSKVIGVEREKNKLRRDLDQWNGEQSKVRKQVLTKAPKFLPDYIRLIKDVRLSVCFWFALHGSTD